MFPDLPQLRRAIARRVGSVAAMVPVRIAVATLLVCFHLAVFTRASHSRLALPFNSEPEAPYFSDPNAGALSEPRQPHHWSRLAVSRFDAQHYIATAKRGLTACPTDPNAPDIAYLDCGLGWLPAWGTLGGAVSSITTLASDKALLMLAILAALALNILWTSPTMVKRLGRGAAWGALIGFNAFPSAFYLVTPYSEAATLALGFAGFIALANERWVFAAALVGASTALQPSSMAFALALAAALGVVAYCRRGQPQWWRPLLALPLCVWGQLVTMIGLQIFVGDWSAYLRARHAFGATYQWSHLFDIPHYMKGLAGQDMDGAMLFATFGIIALTARQAVKRLAPAEATYVIVASAMAVVLSVVTPVQYWGQTRLLLTCMLAFFGLGILARSYIYLFIPWCVLSLAFYWQVDVCDYVAQGNHVTCPSLGNAELSIPLEKAPASLVSLTGHITRNGAPVVGANVSVVGADGSPLAKARTTADGAFNFVGLPATGVQVVATSLAVGAFALPRAVRLHVGQNRVDIELDLAGSIAGQLVDSMGYPIAKAHVHVECSGCADQDSGDDTTRDDGGFSIGALLGGGTYVINATGQDGAALEPMPEQPPIRVKDGSDHVAGVRFVVKPR
jgi:Carboxypeptidase regulatory-like domain